MNWQEKILEYVVKNPGTTDKDMREHFGVSNQVINAVCRNLVSKGIPVRKTNTEKGGLFGLVTGLLDITDF